MAPLTSVPSTGLVTSIAGRGRRSERVAVLLNANARSVNDGVRQEIARFIPSDDVYYSRSVDEARAHVSTILENGYTTVLTGGGDGTFADCVTSVLNDIDEEPFAVVPQGNTAMKIRTRRRQVRFGVLRLGTGNALAHLFGASATTVGLVEDILRARAGDLVSTRPLHLISTEGRLAPFAGLGTDAKVLNDFVKMKRAFTNTPFEKMASGLTGYLVSTAGISIPSTLLPGKAPNVEIVNEGAPAQQLGPDGAPVGKPIATGEVIYKGPCRIVAAGTIPTYGFGFTMFPHALRNPGRLQLRLTAMTNLELVRYAPAIWKGHTPCASILDFSAQKVRLSFDRQMPFQISGDAEGTRDKMTFAVDPRTVEMLDFNPHG